MPCKTSQHEKRKNEEDETEKRRQRISLVMQAQPVIQKPYRGCTVARLI